MCATYPAHLIPRDLTLINTCWRRQIMKLFIQWFCHNYVSSSLLRPNIPLSVFFSDTSIYIFSYGQLTSFKPILNGSQIYMSPISAYFPYFGKNISRFVRWPCCLCVCLSPNINFWMPEQIFMKLCMHIMIMATEPISTAYFINPSHQSVCLYVNPSYRC
jgi:hypothetical protein